MSQTTSAFAGMSQDQLRAVLATAQTALIDLVTGGKPVMVTYVQGDGTRSVSYARTDELKLRNLIRELSGALGLLRPRRALRVTHA